MFLCWLGKLVNPKEFKKLKYSESIVLDVIWACFPQFCLLELYFLAWQCSGILKEGSRDPGRMKVWTPVGFYHCVLLGKHWLCSQGTSTLSCLLNIRHQHTYSPTWKTASLIEPFHLERTHLQLFDNAFKNVG